MSSFSDVLRLYDRPPEETVREVADFTRDAFSPEGQPVLICAYNEEQDLPVTLAALARSDSPVFPVVVDNASTDRTAEFAAAMGADVINEGQPAKIFSLQRGLAYLAIEQGRQTILLTDADSAMHKSWARLAREKLAEEDVPSLVSGTAVFHSLGEKDRYPGINISRGVYTVLLHYSDYLRNKPVIGRGHNMAIRVDSPKTAEALIDGLDPSLVSTDDIQLSQLMYKLGGVCRHLTDPRTIVATRGDRVNNFRDAFRCFMDDDYLKKQLYVSWFERANGIKIDAS